MVALLLNLALYPTEKQGEGSVFGGACGIQRSLPSLNDFDDMIRFQPLLQSSSSVTFLGSISSWLICGVVHGL
jgi:hypothetical protein